VIDQITKFVNVLNAAADGTPHKVIFSLRKFPSTTEYILIGDRLLYNKNIKLFHKILRDLLYGTLDVTCTPIGSLGAEPILFFDIHQFVWETVNRISDDDIEAICKDIDSVTVSKTKHPVKDFSLFSRDSVDSIVVFYFQVIPKPVRMFLEDFETTKRVHYYRSLIRMALLDYIKLEVISHPVPEPTSSAVTERTGTTQSPLALLEINLPKVEPMKVKDIIPPKTVREDIGTIPIVIEKQIETLLQGKTSEPAPLVPVDQISDGTRKKVSKVRIENLRKILQNIKQL